MADFPGTLALSLLLGTNHGLTAPVFNSPLVGVLAPSEPFGADAFTPVPDDETPATTGIGNGVIFDCSPGTDWFQRFHRLPRGTIDFGVIVTSSDRRVEVFSAHRRQTASLNPVTISDAPGVVIPDLPSLPYAQHPFTSVLDPLSGDLAPIALLVRALRDGPPSFLETITFTYDLGSVVIPIAGVRAVLFAFAPEAGYDETIEFLTEVHSTVDGREQRVSIRKQPRQGFEFDVPLDGRARREMQSTLFSLIGRQVTVPSWVDRMRLTSPTVIGGTVLAVDSTTDVDVRVGGLVVVWEDERTFEVLTVASVGPTSVTVTSALMAVHPAGSLAVPARVCRFDGAVQGARHPVNLEAFRPRFVVSDNDTGAPTADDGTFPIFSGKTVIDDCNFLEATSPEAIGREVFVLDGEAGLVTEESPWASSVRASMKGFRTGVRADLFALRRLLLFLRGRQVSFWLPTFQDDLVPTQGISSAAIDLFVENVGYSRHVAASRPRDAVRVTLSNGTVLRRRVLTAVEVDDDEEHLTVDSAWGVTASAADVRRIDFLMPVRLDSDRLVIRHGRSIGRARVGAPVREVIE